MKPVENPVFRSKAAIRASGTSDVFRPEKRPCFSVLSRACSRKSRSSLTIREKICMLLFDYRDQRRLPPDVEQAHPHTTQSHLIE